MLNALLIYFLCTFCVMILNSIPFGQGGLKDREGRKTTKQKKLNISSPFLEMETKVTFIKANQYLKNSIIKYKYDIKLI